MKNNITAGNRDYFSRGLVVDDDGQRIPISQSRFPTGVVFLIGLGLLVEGNPIRTVSISSVFVSRIFKVLQEALIDPQIDAFRGSKAFLTTGDSTDTPIWPTAPNNPGSRNY